MSKPNYSLMQKTLEDKLIEIEKLLLYLEKSEYDRDSHDLNFELLEVKFKLQRSIKHCSGLRR